MPGLLNGTSRPAGARTTRLRRSRFFPETVQSKSGPFAALFIIGNMFRVGRHEIYWTGPALEVSGLPIRKSSDARARRLK